MASRPATIPIRKNINQQRQQPEPTPGKSKFISAVAMLISASLVGWWWFGESIEGHFILNDLRDYASNVRHSDLDTASKMRVTTLIHQIEDQVREGKNPEYWDDTDEAIRDVLSGDIGRDFKLVELELHRVHVELMSGTE